MENQQPTIGVKERDTYSRVVTVLKWVFPAMAILLLASIFLLSKTKVGEIIVMTDDIRELAIGQKITNPHFSGVTKSGDAFSISAEWALPDGPTPAQLELNRPRTTIDFKDGTTMRTNAGAGDLNLKSSEARLSGGVKLRTTNGYVANCIAMLINFESGNVISDGPVQAEGPVGSIESGSMTLVQDLHLNTSGNAVLMFKNGVKLIYKPKG
mgnify:CR=1 FL=1